jgi:hypothetical protein
MKDKKLGIIVTCFNRSDYTKKCLQSIKESLLQCYIIQKFALLLIDDHSTQKEAIDIFDSFTISDPETQMSWSMREMKLLKKRNELSKGIEENLKEGFDFLFESGCSVVLNLDNDAIIKKDGLNKILSLYYGKGGQTIITGFNSNSKNKDGSERHKLINDYSSFTERKSVGGINMCMNKEVYEKYMRPTLSKSKTNWDANTCHNLSKDGKSIFCTKPSVIQHIGYKSSLGHNYPGEEIDVADDFFDRIELPHVTLIGIDCIAWERLEFASLKCVKGIKFGAVKMLTSKTNTHPIFVHGGSEHRDWINIPHINNREEYSNFCIKKMDQYVDTSHALVFQRDGYVVDHTKWNNEWLQYDYIGATWGYKDNMNVGNGGFSLRSKKLLHVLANDPQIKICHPEDHIIGRVYRKYLEDNYDIKFAPEEVANQFSIEAYGSHVFAGGNKYCGSFGYHGGNVDFSMSTIKK